MKLKAREESDLRRKDAKKTGGGPPLPSPSTTSQTVGNNYDPIETPFDDDAGSCPEVN